MTTYYLRRLVEEAGTTTTIQEVMVLLNAALSKLLWEVVAVGGQRVSVPAYSLALNSNSAKITHPANHYISKHFI